jgi:hypothetical protein
MAWDVESDTVDEPGGLPIEFTATADFIAGLCEDDLFRSATRGRWSIDDDPDVSAHAFDLATVATIITVLLAPFQLLELGPKLRALFEKTGASRLYIKTPQREVVFTYSSPEELQALPDILKTLL